MQTWHLKMACPAIIFFFLQWIQHAQKRAHIYSFSWLPGTLSIAPSGKFQRKNKPPQKTQRNQPWYQFHSSKQNGVDTSDIRAHTEKDVGHFNLKKPFWEKLQDFLSFVKLFLGWGGGGDNCLWRKSNIYTTNSTQLNFIYHFQTNRSCMQSAVHQVQIKKVKNKNVIQIQSRQ